MKKVILTAAAMLGFASFAGAQAQSKGLIQYFTQGNVAKTLTELGMTDVSARKQQVGEGQSVDVVSFSNAGVKHVGIYTACSKPGCLGIELLTIWGDNAGKSASRTALNSYNATYGFGKGFVGPSGTLVFSRYAISDGGITVENLKANIGNFIAGSRNFQQYMAKSASGGEASLAPGDAVMQHVAARAATPEADGVLVSLGSSAGLNTLSLQSSPIPDAPVLIKPAQ